MSTRIEGMIKMVLGAMGIDPVEVQKEVVTRVQNFEKDFGTLTQNISQIHADNADIKHNLSRLLSDSGRLWETAPENLKTANGDEENGNDARGIVPAISRAN
jgi:hypothetical protein